MRDILGQIGPRNSPAHLHLNRNKRSIALDLRDPEDQKVFWKLHESADIFVDGSVAGAAERRGIGYEAQRVRNPGIIYCQATGFGATGPYAQIPTHGRMQTALGGAYPMTKGNDGRVVQVVPEPSAYGTTKGAGYAASPSIAGAYAVAYIASALYARTRSGQGCYLDVGASDAIIAAGWMAPVYTLNWDRLTDMNGLPDDPQDPEFEERVKYQFYETADEEFVLFCCAEPKFWNKFCDLVGRDDLKDSDDSGSVALDFGHNDEKLRAELSSIIGSRTQDEWLALAAKNHLPIGPSPRIAKLADDPHIQSREILRDYVHPEAGPFLDVAPPVISSAGKWKLRHPAPAHGQHSSEILQELGLDSRRSP